MYTMDTDTHCSPPSTNFGTSLHAIRGVAIK